MTAKKKTPEAPKVDTARPRENAYCRAVRGPQAGLYGILQKIDGEYAVVNAVSEGVPGNTFLVAYTDLEPATVGE